MQIVVPVAPLSKRIIEKRFPQEIIKLSKRDIMYQQLCYFTLSASRSSKVQDRLTEEVTIQVGNQLAKKIQARLYQVGQHLYNIHCKMMMWYVEAQTDAGISAKEAMMNFYTKHGMNEDDYSLESAYRRWTRYKSELSSNQPDYFFTDKWKFDPEMSRSAGAILRAKIPYSDDELLQLLLQFNKKYFRFYNEPPSRKLRKHTYIFICYEIGARPINWMTSKFKTTRQGIWYARSAMDSRCTSNGNLRQILASLKL